MKRIIIVIVIMLIGLFLFYGFNHLHGNKTDKDTEVLVTTEAGIQAEDTEDVYVEKEEINKTEADEPDTDEVEDFQVILDDDEVSTMK